MRTSAVYVAAHKPWFFTELAFDAEQAHEFEKGAEREVKLLLAFKRQLGQEISVGITENHSRLEEAAAKLTLSRLRVSDVVNQKPRNFSVDALVTMLEKLGKPVTVTVG